MAIASHFINGDALSIWARTVCRGRKDKGKRRQKRKKNVHHPVTSSRHHHGLGLNTALKTEIRVLDLGRGLEFRGLYLGLSLVFHSYGVVNSKTYSWSRVLCSWSIMVMIFVFVLRFWSCSHHCRHSIFHWFCTLLCTYCLGIFVLLSADPTGAAD